MQSCFCVRFLCLDSPGCLSWDRDPLWFGLAFWLQSHSMLCSFVVSSTSWIPLVSVWHPLHWAFLSFFLSQLRSRPKLWPHSICPISTTIHTNRCSLQVQGNCFPIERFLSFFLYFWRPNPITGLSGWWTPDRTQETVLDRRNRRLLLLLLLMLFCHRTASVPITAGTRTGSV